MIHLYGTHGGCLTELGRDPGIVSASAATWIDLLEPTAEEETALEQALGVDIPTREEMREIETSSRLYRVDGTLYMTAVVVSHADSRDPRTTPVTFVLTPGRLITIRYDTPYSFEIFRARCRGDTLQVSGGSDVLIGLLATIVDRAADILERVGGDLDVLSREIFLHTGENVHPGAARKRERRPLETVIEDVGRSHDVVFRLRESLQSLERLFVFLRANADAWGDADLEKRLAAQEQDIASIREYDAFLSNKVDFMLDATLGLVGLQQNRIIKIFSVAAVIFMPPTLVASIYGMNFEYMPELSWLFGYPWALALMVIAAVVPYWFFRWRGWL